MKKSYLWMVAAIGMATAWTGCSKDDNGFDNTQEVAIMAKSKALTLEVETKAPFEGAISGTNNLTARVLVSKTEDNYSALHTNGTMTFTANGETPVAFASIETGGNKSFPGDQTIYMVGLYPAAIGTGGWSTFGTATTHPIDGKSDIMTAAQVSTSKSAATGTTPSYPTLAFTHKLTKLNILVVAGGDDATAKAETSAAWGKITDLSLTQAKGSSGLAAVNTIATVTFSTNAVTFGTTGTIPFYKAGATAYHAKDTVVANLGEKSIEIPTAAARVAYSLVTPVTLSGTDAQNAYVLNIKTTTATTAIPVTVQLTPKNAEVTNTAGYAFNVTLTFKGTEIKATATVTDWVAGGTGAGTIE
ncbi:hypothetical protein M2137_002373 [Parabacteroides sp. PFB2-10]|uniref:hypothetical protein n=1 Tax=Parabacteroides sp. PFB2-10 TaxID=1742405 RepID=UPI002472FCD0|nr:hypothetical protein [Parabacteroides sp. PFB2-10]MDH6313583.1 hypothetical protein [Parabacteroides sp. PFB2-10]MDL2245292.1 hypothetical protein [Parabacteroides sp. OttesenSCG-928-J18]